MSKKSLFKQELKVINVGLSSFGDDLKKHGIPMRHVEWKQPTKGKKEKTS